MKICYVNVATDREYIDLPINIMLFYVITNKRQEIELENLQKLHEENFVDDNEFHELLVKFIQDHKTAEQRPYFFEKIADVIRHIIYSFRKYQAEPEDGEFEEVMERDYAMMLGFFFNAYAFLYLIKNSKYRDQVDFDSDLLNGTKFFRDCFAH